MSAHVDGRFRDTAESRGDMLDLSALWLAIKRRRLWILGPTVAALGLSFVAVNMIPARYTGEARILLENRDSFYTRPGGADSGGQTFDAEAVQSQVQVIMSRDLAREAIKRIGLVGNAEFDSGAGSLNPLKRLGAMLGGAHPADRSPEDRVLEKFYDRLLVFPVGRSRIVAVEFTSQDAALAARGANEVAAVYLEMQEAAKQDTARSASSWLSNTIEPLRKRVADAEARVEEFRSRNGLLVGSNNTTITSQQLTDLSAQLSAARSQQAEAQAKAGLIRDAIRQGRTFEIPDVANNELVRRLIEQRVNLRAQIALETRTLLPEHPRIKELTAQIADLENQLRAASERAVRTLENEAKISGQRVESFTAALDGQKKSASTANDSEVQLRALEREARTLREQLEQYMQRYREAVARDAQNATPADARVISRASEPTQPSFPKKVPTVLVATLAAFLVSLAAVVSRELLQGQQGAPRPAAARTPGWVAAKPLEETDDQTRRETRVAGLLTHGGRLGQIRLDPGEPSRALADLAERIAAPRRGMAPLVALFDSAGREALGSADLAEMISQRSRSILLDLRQDDDGRTLGLSELLAGEALFSDIITRETGSRLHRIGSGRAGREAVLAATDLLDVALEALCETYDWVFVALGSSDPLPMQEAVVSRAQAALVMAGRIGNGHAVEAAYKLGEMTQAPVTLVLDQEVGESAPSRSREPVSV